MRYQELQTQQSELMSVQMVQRVYCLASLSPLWLVSNNKYTSLIAKENRVLIKT